MISAPKGPVRDLALRMTKFTKLAEDVRAMFAVLAEGGLVNPDDLKDGLLAAMECAVTCAGQSMARRKNAEQIRVLGEALFGPIDMGGVYQPTNFKWKPSPIPDLTSRPAVEAWLES